MNFKKFHESKNLFDVGRVRTSSIISVNSTTITKELSQYNIDIFSGTSGAGAALSTLCMVLDAGTYTLSFDVVTGNASLFLICACPYTSETRTPTKQLYDCATGKSFTLSEKSYVSLRVQQNTLAVVKDIMLNTGSTALPYEPYSSEVWHDTHHYIHNTSADTITALPAVLYPTGTTATVGLKGNTLQSSIPSPTSPVMPQETGERTGNLLDKTGFTSVSATIEQIEDGIRIITQSGGYAARIVLDVLQNTNYTVSYIWKYISGNSANTVRVFAGTGTQTQIAIFEYSNGGTFNTGNNTKINIWFYAAFGTVATVEYTKIMLNTGSTALPYEPYGQYKIPILSASTTTSVYLGEVETTRKIRKLVLTGEENITFASEDANRMVGVFTIPNMRIKTSEIGYCNILHWKNEYSQSDYNRIVVATSNVFYMSLERSILPEQTIDGFITYLRQQYTAGTPVCVWYVLAEPETAIVNEPLRKIGDYADTVSGITIPTIAGANTLSVDTTLQPSEVSVNYKGWHPVQSVHERESGAWT